MLLCGSAAAQSQTEAQVRPHDADKADLTHLPTCVSFLLLVLLFLFGSAAVVYGPRTVATALN